MKFLRQGLSLAMVGVGLAAVPALTAAAAPAQPDDLVAQMREEANSSVTVRRSPATDKVAFLTARGRAGDLLPGVSANSRADAVTKASAYLDKYARAFGARADELRRSSVTKDAHGTTVSFTQVYRDVPVFGSTIKVNVDRDGDLRAVNGFAAPDLDLSVTPGASAAEAGEAAVNWVRADPPTSGEHNKSADTTGIKAVDPTLVVYRKGAISGEAGKSVLAYQVEVTNGSNIRDMVFFDAEHLKILNRYTLVHDALERRLHEDSPDTDPVWVEGDDFPGSLNDDQQNLVNSAGESYWLYHNAFGRDSYDGEGAEMVTVNNDPRIECPNANWNGTTTNYCDGVTSDDVVSHEWGHAYTEYTSGLIYQYQSGALNESYSDVWGETLDMVNGREDEDELFTEVRPHECETSAPAGLEMEITAPESIAGPCVAVEAGFGPGFTTTPTTAEVVVAEDAADETGPSTTDGCSAYTNAAAVAGNYAYVDRGTCTFQEKVDNAVAAGATGIVVGNNNVDYPINMSGVATIPGVMVGMDDGERFKSVDAATVTIQAEDTSDRHTSTRWMVGEKSSAFGGAIRDMWMPTCMGDPGKVSDAEYKCDPGMTDNGGVHSNSGVPNHAYALTVDGGDFNGQTIEGIGIDKAANIWWRAQSAYLTPTSNFVDAADALEQSCADLVGQTINEISTEPDAGATPTESIATGDCDQLAKAITATEMRVAPVRCDFQPLLQPGSPSPCGEGFTTEAFWSEDFEDGLAGWGTDQEIADLPEFEYAGGFGKPWEATDDAPGDHPGGVAYGSTEDLGDCSGDGVNDFSSRDSITSPIVEMPATLRTPRLTFDHYVATEAGYDGGNVKVSINGRPFEVIPAAAYTFNAPAGEIFDIGQGNTNPMGGEEGFTGTDGGEVRGSWGQSQVNINALGVEGGDTVQFRFDVGRDGCGGIDGWYVDNVELVDCKLPVSVTATHEPEPVTVGDASVVNVEVERDGNVGSTPTGAVTLLDPDGVEVGEAELDKGRASIPVPADLGVGSYEMTVAYSGTKVLAAAETTVTVTVTGVGVAASKTKAKAKPKKIQKNKASKVSVVVSAKDATATGKVEIRLKGKVLASGSLADGKVTIKVKGKTLKKGKNKLTAAYLGSATVEPSSDKFTIKVKRSKKK